MLVGLRDQFKLHFRNVVVVGFPNVFSTASVFIRGVFLARLLAVHEFGLALIIISIIGALDMFSDAGIDRFVVQHKFGYREDLMRTGHAYRVVGSSIVGLSIVLLSYPLALLFKAPDLWVGIAATGGIVIIRGLINLSYKLQQRDHRFEVETVIDISRYASDLLVTALCAFVFRSYWAALAGTYANALVALTISHVWRREPRYSFLPRKALLGLVGRFSTPIYINASMLFAAMQGDRMVVAAMFSKNQLALYSVACTVGQGIAQLTGKVSERLLLPIMVGRDASKAKRRKITNFVGLIMIGGSFAFLLLISIFSPMVTQLIYGPAYHGIRSVVAAAAIFQMIQIQQAWLNSVLMANGITTAFPKITMMRAAAFPAAVVLVWAGLSFVAIPLAFALGAAGSLGVSFYAARRLELIDRRLMIVTFAGIAMAIAMVAWLSLTGRI